MFVAPLDKIISENTGVISSAGDNMHMHKFVAKLSPKINPANLPVAILCLFDGLHSRLSIEHIGKALPVSVSIFLGFGTVIRVKSRRSDARKNLHDASICKFGSRRDNLGARRQINDSKILWRPLKLHLSPVDVHQHPIWIFCMVRESDLFKAAHRSINDLQREDRRITGLCHPRVVNLSFYSGLCFSKYIREESRPPLTVSFKSFFDVVGILRGCRNRHNLVRMHRTNKAIVQQINCVAVQESWDVEHPVPRWKRTFTDDLGLTHGKSDYGGRYESSQGLGDALSKIE